MSIDHWMMFSTFAEQEYFAYPDSGDYRGVIINANMAVYAPAGLAAFLLGKTGEQTRYVIDPLTHAFQHDPNAISNPEGETKTSIREVANRYGGPVAQHVGKKPLLPSDFTADSILEIFVQQCLNFQREQLSRYMKDSDLVKYLEDPFSELFPYAIVAPYFFLMERTLKDWLPINMTSAKIASAIAEDFESRCFAAVVVSKGVLVSENARKQIGQAFADIRLDGYFLWVDELDEQLASEAELRGLLDLAAHLRLGGEREVVNLHGGYFSVLAAGKLGKAAFSGVTHAPEFGEHRGVIPVGGGIPISRYYVPQLHARVRYRDALAMFRANGWLDSAESFHKEVCNCDVCVATLDGNPENFALYGDSTTRSVRRRHGIARIQFPTQEARKRCLKHYLQCKHREYEAAGKAPEHVLLNNLKEGEAKFSDIVGLEGVAHLGLWHDILNEEE